MVRGAARTRSIAHATNSLTLDAIGSRLAGWVDCELLCTLDESSLASGDAGLYSAAGPARFSRFSVWLPAWARLHRFADGDPLADGRRNALRAIPPTGAAVNQAGCEFRLAQGPRERPWAPPTSVPLKLRVVSAAGTPCTSRAFVDPRSRQEDRRT